MSRVTLGSCSIASPQIGKLPRLPFDRKVSDECLVLRFCHQVFNISIHDLAIILDFSDDVVKKMYYGSRNKDKIGEFVKLYTYLDMDREILLYYIHEWKNTGNLPYDLPLPIPILGSDGKITKERYWFQRGWFQENFKHEDSISVMRITDNSLATYGFCRGDIVIASRLPEHMLFRTQYVYMLQERDGGIYPRVSDLSSVKNDESNRILKSSIDPNDQISFAPLPTGVVMIGRIVWKSSLL